MQYMFYENYQPVVDKTIYDTTVIPMENTLGLPKATSNFLFDNRVIEIDICDFLKNNLRTRSVFFSFQIQRNNYFGNFTYEPESPSL